MFSDVTLPCHAVMFAGLLMSFHAANLFFHVTFWLVAHTQD